jgi:O-antigen/teichoic acid export membrane protein
MADARSVARGAVWNYSAQIASALAQIAYAGITSRLAEPHEFGVYAAAWSSVLLINIIALAGLPQVVGRMTDLDGGRLRGLLLFAVAIGVVAAAGAAASAPLWAFAWDLPGSVPVIHILAITSFATPLVALANGLSLRLGLFRRLAAVTVTTNLCGMLVGVVVVLLHHDAESLAVSQVVSQVVAAAVLLVMLRRRFRGRVHLRTTLTDARYSAKALVSALLTYSIGAVGKVTVSQTIGPVPLGNWNRADAITTNPFYLLGNAISQAVYPEFRHDLVDRTRTRRVWADLLGIIGWVTVPLGAVVAVLAPIATQLLLGEGWTLAGQYGAVLAVIGALQPVVFLLVSGFEALGRFDWNWIGFGVSLAINVAAAVAAGLVHSIWPIFVGTLVAFAVFHPMQLLRARREGLIDLGRVGRHYVGIALCSVAAAAYTWAIVHVADLVAVSPALAVGAGLVGLAGIALVVAQRHRFPPIRLARAYGLLGRGRPADDASAAAATVEQEPEPVQRG